MAASPFSLEGKVAIVTGGGVGIGKSIAIEFARAGADVAIASRKIEHLEPVTAEIKKLGRRSFALAVDVRQEDQVKGLVEKTVKDLGKLDVMVNNAGASFRAKVGGHLGERLEHRGGDQPQRGLLRVQVGGPADDGPGRRRHHQHLVHRRRLRLDHDVALRRLEGRRHQLHARRSAWRGGARASGSTASRRAPWRRRDIWTCSTRPIRTPRRSMTAWPTAWASAAGARWRRSPTPASSSPPTPPAS